MVEFSDNQFPNAREHARDDSEVVVRTQQRRFDESVLRGELNAVGQTEIPAVAAPHTVFDDRVKEGSIILLMPEDVFAKNIVNNSYITNITEQVPWGPKTEGSFDIAGFPTQLGVAVVRYLILG